MRTWFAQHPPPYGADRFNNSQQTKGIPDVSANGANYVIAIDGRFSLVYGTSASSPTFGSVVTLINEARIAAGKSSVGFINPTLYAHPNVLNGEFLPTSDYHLRNALTGIQTSLEGITQAVELPASKPYLDGIR